jgi:hypothetical protein
MFYVVVLSDVLISLGLSCLGRFQSASWCGLSNFTELAIGLLQMVAKWEAVGCIA